jgi:phenylpyruvate tautomerase PptA (4-oxalocrotonate tautomerase family)
MPLIQVFTTAKPDTAASDKLLRELSGALAAHFEKPEQWVMTSIVPGLAMTFGGSPGPTCFAAVKNIGKLPAAKSAKLSADLSTRLAQGLGVPQNRIYLEFTEAVGHLWGFDGGTFG